MWVSSVLDRGLDLTGDIIKQKAPFYAERNRAKKQTKIQDYIPDISCNKKERGKDANGYFENFIT